MNRARDRMDERGIVLRFEQIERGIERFGGMLASSDRHLQPRLLNEQPESTGQRQFAFARFMRVLAGARELADGHQHA